MLRQCNSAADLEGIRRSIPLGRFCSPEEVADLVFFLELENHHITGQVFAIDGGFSVQ